MLPVRVRRHFNLGWGRAERLHHGTQADTYRIGDLIVQRVSTQSIEHHEAVIALTAGLRSSGRLPGVDFRGHPLHITRGFWRAAPRIEGQPASDLGLSFLDALDTHAADLADELALLATLAVPTYFPAPAIDQRLTPRMIEATLAESLSPDKRLLELLTLLPTEPSWPSVVAHGDPVAKNVLVSNGKAVLS